ncbi:hypothetical protein M153_2790008393 [Pseudoloma neurophilia]|uniref:Uncharacterized protein n=1 Tax=Pseudoloma neurophilia TaxID=146866 RepID=A0A0R0M5J5_9MICR|nr:hypothetical protein M153_2790008393 [Pseudoloma neurophilia]
MKNKIQIIKSHAQTNRIKETLIKFECINKRKYTIITAQIFGIITTPYIEKRFMESIPVPLLVNEQFETQQISFNCYIPADLPGSFITIHGKIEYFVVVKVFEGVNELADIRCKFRLFSQKNSYNFAEMYILDQMSSRIGTETYEEEFLGKMKQELSELHEMNRIFNEKLQLTDKANVQITNQLDKTDETEQNSILESTESASSLTKPYQVDLSSSEVYKILEHKIQTILSSNYISKLKIKQHLDQKESHSNIFLYLNPDEKFVQKDIKILLWDKKEKLAELKSQNFFFTNEINKIEIFFMKKVKRLRYTLKMIEEVEYTNKETIIYHNVRTHLEFIKSTILKLPRISNFSFKSDLINISFFLEVKINDCLSTIPLTLKKKKPDLSILNQQL